MRFRPHGREAYRVRRGKLSGRRYRGGRDRKARESYYGRNRIQFVVSDIGDLSQISADLVISLGLFDWLKDDEIASVFQKSGAAEFLHAIAERRPGFQQWLHRYYVQVAYGHRRDSYRPRYLTCEHVKSLATIAKPRPLFVYRNWRLSFGALISSLPIGEEVSPRS
jgi:hypothetical protein